MTVTFVGHRDAPRDIYDLLCQTIHELIQNEGATNFYVGEQGAFDQMALKALCELKRRYPYINCQIVLAYMPLQHRGRKAACATLFPPEVAVAPARFAIDRRNRWMIENSDVVIAYVRRSYGGAAAFRKRAVTRGKRIIDIF